MLPSVFVDYSYDTFGRRYQVTAVAGSTTTNQYDGFNILDTWPQALESYAGMNLAGLDWTIFSASQTAAEALTSRSCATRAIRPLPLPMPTGTFWSKPPKMLTATPLTASPRRPRSLSSPAAKTMATAFITCVPATMRRNRALYRPRPIGIAGGLNRYEYAGHNPTNATDPTGLYCSRTQRDVAVTAGLRTCRFAFRRDRARLWRRPWSLCRAWPRLLVSQAASVAM